MTLKWLAVVVAAVSLTLFVTTNVVVGTVRGGGPAPLLVNVLALTVAGTATVLAVVAGLHERLDARITALTDFLVARLNDLDRTAGDSHTAFVEGYLLSRAQDPAVVPIGPRLRERRAMISGDD
ncbi:hypothetical protein [Micromonospora sp. HM5-17]|jgi:hypothetical protein|uniref:hypothetical protein n=1 Tax=Micromonospora sp. HM5-17 TaxID=2487710 RepID=UPI000F466BE2|nr:hypothetical protein [Micromonospora sp. HM5-17]ROT32141.1 hypothetical protein EF879_11060 [Micromonospora sp. HM5-17]